MREIALKFSVAILLAIGCASIVPAQNPQAPPSSKLEKVADDLYVISGDGGNTSVYLTNAGVVLVDAKFDRDHDDIVAKVGTLTDKPVRYVFNTHPHSDHTGGNEKMQVSAEIIGHRNTRADMIEQKLPAPPSITFTDEIALHPGGKEVVARHIAPGHTNGDVVVYFPASRVVAMGDMFNTGTFGVFFDYKSGGSILEWTRTLDEALKWDFDIVIPGHGPLARRADLMKARSDVEAIRNRIRAMIREGKTADRT